jgi:hypothetical protein
LSIGTSSKRISPIGRLENAPSGIALPTLHHRITGKLRVDVLTAYEMRIIRAIVEINELKAG